MAAGVRRTRRVGDSACPVQAPDPAPVGLFSPRPRGLAATTPAFGRYVVSIGVLNMNSIVYIVGAVVIVLAILGFLGLR